MYILGLLLVHWILSYYFTEEAIWFVHWAINGPPLPPCEMYSTNIKTDTDPMYVYSLPCYHGQHSTNHESDYVQQSNTKNAREVICNHWHPKNTGKWSSCRNLPITPPPSSRCISEIKRPPASTSEPTSSRRSICWTDARSVGSLCWNLQVGNEVYCLKSQNLVDFIAKSCYK